MTFDPVKDDVTVDLVNVLNFNLDTDEYERLLSNVVWVKPGERWRGVDKGDLEFQVVLDIYIYFLSKANCIIYKKILVVRVVTKYLEHNQFYSDLSPIRYDLK